MVGNHGFTSWKPQGTFLVCTQVLWFLIAGPLNFDQSLCRMTFWTNCPIIIWRARTRELFAAETHCSSSRCLWLLPRKFPYWQECTCSWICSKNHSLNSNAWREESAVRTWQGGNGVFMARQWRRWWRKAVALLSYLRELFCQLPHTFQELGENGRHLLRVSIQLIAPGFR